METIYVAGTMTTQSCEVFESNGAFQVILGKPWLCSMQAVHRYDMDEITIQAQGLTRTINNDNMTQEVSPGHSPRQGDKLPNEAMDTHAAKHQGQTNDAKKGQERVVQSAPIQERSAQIGQTKNATAPTNHAEQGSATPIQHVQWRPDEWQPELL